MCGLAIWVTYVVSQMYLKDRGMASTHQSNTGFLKGIGRFNVTLVS